MGLGVAGILAPVSRLLPFPGRDALLRKLYPPEHFRDQRKVEEFVVSYDSTLRLLCDPGSEIEWCVLFKGYYEVDLSNFLKTLVKPGMIVFDVGANVGVHSILTGSRVTDSGKVFAFEPNPGIRRRLQNNLQLNDLEHRVSVIPLGLSDRTGKARFWVPLEGSPNMGISSLHPSADLPVEIEILLSTLDDFFERQGLERLDVLKIDTEGNDMAVLRGARNVLERFSPTIIVEIHYGDGSDRAERAIEEGKRFLIEAGYDFYRFSRLGRLRRVDPALRLDPGNLICMK